MLHRLPRLGAALMLSLFLFSATPTYAWHFHGDPVHDAENINLEKKILEQVKQIHESTDRVAAYAIGQPPFAYSKAHVSFWAR